MKVVVGLSGGVDSSVAAYLLKKAGHQVIGIFMRNWSNNDAGPNCTWVEDSTDALLVAEKLDIPFQVVDLSEAYYTRVVEYMFAEYAKGRTPNPDVLCNREIKFDVFLQVATDLGADAVATGHYARVRNNNGTYELLAGVDATKDQSYFLCQLNQKQLSKAIFPIGELHKKEVRALAQELGLITAQKKDSQGLCFVGHIQLPVFLQQKLQSKKGAVVLLPKNLIQYQEKNKLEKNIKNLPSLAEDFSYQPEDGKIIGEHIGAHYYTVGQRKGLQIGGFKNPLFILQIDTEKNIVYVGEGEDHPGLYRPALELESLHFLDDKNQFLLQEKKDFLVRIRYRQDLQKATLYQQENQFFVLFEKNQRAIAKGQFAAFYQEEVLKASGVII